MSKVPETENRKQKTHLSLKSICSSSIGNWLTSWPNGSSSCRATSFIVTYESTDIDEIATAAAVSVLRHNVTYAARTSSPHANNQYWNPKYTK